LKKTILTALCFVASFSFAQVTVSLAAPSASSTSPVAVRATASSAHPITGWEVYLDGSNVFSSTAASINTTVAASQGTHQIVVRAWDSSGAYGSQTVETTVAASATTTAAPTTVPTTTASATAATSTAGLPTPPSTAKIYSAIEQTTTGWASCDTPACAGGAGGGSFIQDFDVTSPSLSGRSMEIYHDGSNSNALWYHKVGADDSVSNFLWDFYVQLDSASVNAAQALEYDAFQFVGGYNYMIGTECNYAAGVWDTWNESAGKWLHSTIPCKKFTPNTWHHIQWYMTNNHTAHTYTYKTLVVDGVAYTLNQTQPAKNLGWSDNLGVQWQLDVNSSGTGYHEWVDNATFTTW
jgi:hypothetical protein